MAPELSVATIDSVVRENISYAESGVQCYFVPLNDEWAVKLYRTPESRDRSYQRQKSAARFGLGPEVGYTIDLPHLDREDWEETDCYRYGYLTEIVETFVDEVSDWQAWEWFSERRDELMPIIIELQETIGFYFEDYHGHNWGMKNGQYVCIDFG